MKRKRTRLEKDIQNYIRRYARRNNITQKEETKRKVVQYVIAWMKIRGGEYAEEL